MREMITIPLVVMVIAAVVILWPSRPQDAPPPKVVRVAELTFLAAAIALFLSVSGKPVF